MSDKPSLGDHYNERMLEVKEYSSKNNQEHFKRTF